MLKYLLFIATLSSHLIVYSHNYQFEITGAFEVKEKKHSFYLLVGTSYTHMILPRTRFILVPQTEHSWTA